MQNACLLLYLYYCSCHLSSILNHFRYEQCELESFSNWSDRTVRTWQSHCDPMALGLSQHTHCLRPELKEWKDITRGQSKVLCRNHLSNILIFNSETAALE